jgi:hypothetical protein
MPVEGTVSYEPVAVFTGCICEGMRQGLKYTGVHEPSCPTQPIKVVRPGPRAGRRAWRNYRKQLATQTKASKEHKA